MKPLDIERAREIQENSTPLFYAECLETKDLDGIAVGELYKVYLYDPNEDTIYIMNDDNQIDPHDREQFVLYEGVPHKFLFKRLWNDFNEEKQQEYPVELIQEFIEKNAEFIKTMVDSSIEVETKQEVEEDIDNEEVI